MKARFRFNQKNVGQGPLAVLLDHVFASSHSNQVYIFLINLNATTGEYCDLK